MILKINMWKIKKILENKMTNKIKATFLKHIRITREIYKDDYLREVYKI